VNKFTPITEEQVDKTVPEIIPGTEKSKDIFTRNKQALQCVWKQL